MRCVSCLQYQLPKSKWQCHIQKSLATLPVLIHVDNFWRRAEINKYIYTQVIRPIFHPPPFAMSCKRIRTVSLMLYLPLALFLFWFLCFFFGACTVYFYCRLARCCHIYGAVWQRQTRTFVIWTTSWQLAANADAAGSCRQTARLR